MPTIIDRNYCLKHPHTIIKLFGFGIFLGMVFGKGKSLLERLTAFHSAHGYPLPGKIGDAYRLSALLEYRMARIYSGFAKKFHDNEDARKLFDELRQEEAEHGRLMELCRYTVKTRPSLQYVPSIRDPLVHKMLKDLRNIERNIENLSLSESLKITEKLEQGEINTIFNRLLKQAGQSESLLFEEQMRHTEGHAASVPKRIQALHEKAGVAAA